jgi:hypothetical protein
MSTEGLTMTMPRTTTSGPPVAHAAPGARFPHQWLALVVAVAFLLLGVAGFAVTGFSGFTEYDPSQTVLGLAVNPLHNLVHLLVGVVGLAFWSRADRARTYGWILAVAFGVVALYGFVVSGDADGNVLNLNGADNVLHLVTALVGVLIALWPRRDRSAALLG